MKKSIALALLGLGLFAGTTAYAQDAATPAKSSEKTQQVISSIPALQSITQEISDYESKIAGKKESYENSNADLRALKMKYAAELKTQIAVNQDKQEVLAVLKEELAKTEAEISQLK